MMQIEFGLRIRITYLQDLRDQKFHCTDVLFYSVSHVAK